MSSNCKNRGHPLKKNFGNFLQSISLKKQFDIFSENSKKNFCHKTKRVTWVLTYYIICYENWTQVEANVELIQAKKEKNDLTQTIISIEKEKNQLEQTLKGDIILAAQNFLFYHTFLVVSNCLAAFPLCFLY